MQPASRQPPATYVFLPMSSKPQWHIWFYHQHFYCIQHINRGMLKKEQEEIMTKLSCIKNIRKRRHQELNKWLLLQRVHCLVHRLHELAVMWSNQCFPGKIIKLRYLNRRPQYTPMARQSIPEARTENRLHQALATIQHNAILLRGTCHDLIQPSKRLK